MRKILSKIPFWVILALLIAGAIASVQYFSRGTPGEGQANGSSFWPSVSADGRIVAFHSDATNLVEADDNGFIDVFIKDTESGETRLISSSMDGTPGDGDSKQPSISADGRYVAFTSEASNLVPGDDNGCSDGESEWNCSDVFVKDLRSGEIERVSTSTDDGQGNWFSEEPSISGDGRYVAFTSYASNLVFGDSDACDSDEAPRNCADIFIKDRQTGRTWRTSITPEGVEGDGDSSEPVISSDGNYVAFTSDATNLGVNDNNGVSDIFIANLTSADVTRVTITINDVEADGPSYDPSISADGRSIAFASEATNLGVSDTGLCLEGEESRNCTDIYVASFITGDITRASRPYEGIEISGSSSQPALSGDGRYVTYESRAGNLTSGDAALCDEDGMALNCSDIFLTDLLTTVTSIISINSDREGGTWNSAEPAISANGDFIVFSSYAANLVDGDTDACGDGVNQWNCSDIFLRKVGSEGVSRISTRDGVSPG